MSSDVILKLGQSINALRKKRKWTKLDLGTTCELGEKYICKIEGGQINISFKTLYKIIVALGMAIEEVFKEKE